MDYAFIYVFGDENKDKLIDLGFQLLKSDEKEHVYIFENNGTVIDDKGLVFAFSNTLTF